MAPDRTTAPPADLNPPRRIGERFNRQEGIEMLQKLPMGQLMSLAHTARMRRIPAETVTFVVDTNPNYTNVCATRCSFCAFHRPAGAADAYTLTPQELAGEVKAA